jgi:hypothetical protein
MSKSRALLALAAIVVCGTSAWPAQAHLGGAIGVTPFFDDDGALVGAGTTFGLVFEGPEGGLAQTCDEAIADAIPRAFARVGAHTVSASAAGVFVSDDVGCDWRPLPIIGARAVQALAPSVTSPQTLWAVSVDVAAAGDDPVENVVARVTFDANDEDAVNADVVATGAVGVIFTSVVLVGGDAGDVLVVAGADLVARAPVLAVVDVGVGGALIDVSASLQGALEDAQLVRVLEVNNGRLFFSTLDRIGRGHLFTAAVADVVAAAGDDNAAVAAVELGAFDGLVNASVVYAGHRYVSAGTGVVFRAPIVDEKDPNSVGVGAFERVDSPIVACLIARDDAIFGCTTNAEGYFVRSTDGVTFEPFLHRDDVTDHACPADSGAAAACAYRFVEDVPGEVPNDDDNGADDDGDGSCAQGAGVAHAIALVGLARRRRRWCRRDAEQGSR